MEIGSKNENRLLKFIGNWILTKLRNDIKGLEWDDHKHPIIIQYESHFSKLIILDVHLKILHSNNQATLAYIRQTFSIINAKTVVKVMIHYYIKCIRNRAQSVQQLMGQVPEIRVSSSHDIGVNYPEPITIQFSKGRGNKSDMCHISILI